MIPLFLGRPVAAAAAAIQASNSLAQVNFYNNNIADHRPPTAPTCRTVNVCSPQFAAIANIAAPFPPPGNLPPFRPNFAAGTLPPFPPKGHHGQPPPFPPKYPPGSPGVRPHGSYPLPSAHPGIGLPPLPTGLPNPPHSSANSHSAARSRQDVKTTKIFVGSIAPGIRDQTLKDLLNVSG